MKANKREIVRKILYILAFSGATMALAYNAKTEPASIEESNDDDLEISDEDLDNIIEKALKCVVVRDEETPKALFREENVSVVEVVDTDSIEYNTTEIDVIKAINDCEVKKEMNESSSKLGIFITDRELELISDEDSIWYKVNYYGEEAYINKEDAIKTKKRVFKTNMIAKGYLKENDSLYNSKDLEEEISTLNKLEFIEIYKEYEDCYLVATIDSIGFVKKENVGLLEGNVFVVDISNQEARVYEDNKMTLLAPVVTGSVKTKRESAQGLFTVWHKYPKPRYIVPGAWVECGTFYNKNDGFHDADNWREEWEYGGNTYLTNGSHGCCNMRTEDALYANSVIQLNDKVLIKK